MSTWPTCAMPRERSVSPTDAVSMMVMRMAYCEGFRACFIKKSGRAISCEMRGHYQGYQSLTPRLAIPAGMLGSPREDQENFNDEDGARDSFYGADGCDERVLRAGAWPEADLQREGLARVCGGARIGLHAGPSSPGRKGPKIAFYADDVAAMREKLVARGATFGKVRQWDELFLCDGKDPDGNPIQLSNR